MKTAFLSTKSEGVVTTLKSIKDSLDLVGGVVLVDFLSETSERSEFFDRLVIAENALNSGSEEKDFIFLKDYIESYSPNLEVVMAISRESGSALADTFVNVFSAPMYTVAYLPEKTSTGVLIEMVEKPILEIKAKYFSIDDSQVKAKEALEKTNKDNPKKQKTGFFSKLFGGKKEANKKVEEKEEVVESKVEQPTPVTPSVDPAVSVSSTEVQESINKLFGGTTEVEPQEPTGDLSLNFSDFGESHYQTGFIPEDDLEGGTVNEQSKEESNWLPVDSGESLNPASDFPESSEFSEISRVADLGTPVEQKFGSPNSDFSEDLLQKSGGVLPTLGVTLVVGDESSSFIAKELKTSSGYYIVDIRRSFDLSPYIDESLYLNSDSEFYEEGGNFYILNATVKDLPNLLSGKEKVIVNASIDLLNSLEFQLELFDHIIPVFSNDIARLEYQLLKYEDVSPTLARGIAKSSPVVNGFVSEEVHSLLSRAVFSRINWKGLIK